MKFNKICKKILAYTLTTTMALGVFAGSGINLTTAWANASSLSGGAIVVEDNDITLDGDIVIDGSTTSADDSNLSDTFRLTAGTYASITLNGSSENLIIPAGKKMTIKGAAAASVDATLTDTTDTDVLLTAPANKTCVIAGPAHISAAGVAGGTITGGVAKGCALSGCTLDGVTLEGNTTLGEAGKTTTLKDCKAAQAADALIKSGVNDATNNIVIKGSLTGSTSHTTTLKSYASSSQVDAFNFNNVTVSGKIVGDNDAPLVKGNIKAEGLDLAGKVTSNSTAVISLESGVNKVDLGTDVANLNALTFSAGSGFAGTFEVELNQASNTATKDVFKVSTVDEFARLMKAGKITVTNSGSTSAETDGCFAYISNGVFKHGKLPLSYDKSGQKITISCSAKGCKYDGEIFDVTVKDVAYAKRNSNNGGSNEGKEIALSLSDKAKDVKVNKPNLWAAVSISNTLALDTNNEAPAGTAGSVTIGDATGHYTVVKKDISKAVVNGSAANGITAAIDNSTKNIAAAKNLPDDFVSIELKTNTTGTTASAYNSFDGGRIAPSEDEVFTTTAAANLTLANVTLVYKTEEGCLCVLPLTGNVVSTTTFPNTVGNKSVSVTGTGNFTGTATVNYKVVDQQVTVGDYTGSAQEISIPGASLYSTNGTDFSNDALSFTDAGDYEVYYKTSADADAQFAVCTINPAEVEAVWSAHNPTYGYDGTAKTITVTRINGSLPQDKLDKFDTSGVKYSYVLGSGTAVDKCVNKGTYTVTAILDKNNTANKNFRFANAQTETLTIGNGTAVVNAKDATAYCDGKAHTIDKITINAPEESYKVTYGTTAGDCTSLTAPSYTEEGTYKIYYKVVKDDTYTGADGDNLTYGTALTNGRSYVTLTIKPALTVKRTDSTAKSVTYTGKAYPITA